MAVPILETAPGGEVDFSLQFEDVVFSLLPALCTLVMVLIVVALKRPWASQLTAPNRALLQQQVILTLIVAFHLTSVVVYCRLHNVVPSPDPLGIASYSLRFVTALSVLISRLVWGTDLKLFANMYLLVTCVADGVRVHTLWAAASNIGSGSSALPALQIAIVILSGLSVVIDEIRDQFASKPLRQKAAVRVDEPGSGTLSTVFFGWLLPLLRYGKQNEIGTADLKDAIPRPCAVYDMKNGSHDVPSDTAFFLNVSFHFLGAMALQALNAGATLAQPFIINGIISYLQNDLDRSVGIWLVIAMFLDQMALSLLRGHADQSLRQVCMRIRSFYMHKIALRSFATNPPEKGWSEASGKVLVHITQDVMAVTGGISMTGMIFSNVIVVCVGSYMLFQRLNLAFLGPLLAALLCFAVPILLGKQLSESQKAMLEATEGRMKIIKQLIQEVRSICFGNMQPVMARQATQARKREIEAATTLRRILTVVIVSATMLNTLAILAAFGGFSLLPQKNLDFNILFTSLSTIQIMLTPLLSIVQTLPQFIGAFVSLKRIKQYIAVHAQDPAVSTPEAEKRNIGTLPLELHNLIAKWSADEEFQIDASLTLDEGQLAIVTGPSASGKSSLIDSIVGEMEATAGQVKMRADTKISFCSQTPWFVPELSIRENITFGKAYNEDLYQEVLECCCLRRDFQSLTDGDATKLSQSGSPLSGGQRKRVSLARTLYADGNLFLLDDIFNGLDTKTRGLIASNLLSASGFIRKRNAAALICCAELPTIVSTFPNTKFFVLEAGSLTIVEKEAANIEIAGDAAESELVGDNDNEQNIQSSDAEPAAPSQSEETTLTKKPAASSLDAHKMYFKSFGSPLNIGIVILLLFLFIGIDRGSSFWLSHWTSQYSSSQGSIDNGYYVGIYGALVAAAALASFACFWVFFMQLIPNSSMGLHESMMAVLVKTPVYSVEEQKSETLNKFVNDIEAVDLRLPQALTNLLSAGGASIGSVVIIGVGSPYAMISLVVLLPLLWLLQRFYLATSFQLRKLQVAAQAPMLEMVGAALEGRVTVRAFSRNEFMTRMMSDRIYRANLATYIFTSLQGWVVLMLDLLNGLLATAVAALLVGLGGSKTVSWGGLALVNSIALGQDAMLLLTWWTHFESAMASMDRILDYTKHTPQEAHHDPSSVPDAWPVEGSVGIEGLSLAYLSDNIVKEITLDVEPGSKTAVIGRTGSGKTSMLQSFFGLIRSTGGSIQVDGLNLFSVNSDIIRSRIVGHSQFFVANTSATVRGNLDVDGGVTDARIQEVLARVVTQDMCDDIMSKLDTAWNECNFSEGWRRGIGICRTLLRDSGIYIMDEPTSGMDEATHTATMDAIFDILSDKTVISTTHTLVGIEKFDKIVVVENGELVEQGSPRDLMAREGSMLNSLLNAN